MLLEAAVLAAQMTVASAAPPLKPEEAVAVLRACCTTEDGRSRNVPPVYPAPPPSIAVWSLAGEGPFGPFRLYRWSLLDSSWSSWRPADFWHRRAAFAVRPSVIRTYRAAVR